MMSQLNKKRALAYLAKPLGTRSVIVTFLLCMCVSAVLSYVVAGGQLLPLDGVAYATLFICTGSCVTWWGLLLWLHRRLVRKNDADGREIESDKRDC